MMLSYIATEHQLMRGLPQVCEGDDDETCTNGQGSYVHGNTFCQVWSVAPGWCLRSL